MPHLSRYWYGHNYPTKSAAGFLTILSVSRSRLLGDMPTCRPLNIVIRVRTISVSFLFEARRNHVQLDEILKNSIPFGRFRAISPERVQLEMPAGQEIVELLELEERLERPFDEEHTSACAWQPHSASTG